MNELLKASRFCRVILGSEVLFKVEDINNSYMVNNNKSYVVNFEAYICDCELWQIAYHKVIQCLILLI